MKKKEELHVISEKENDPVMLTNMQIIPVEETKMKNLLDRRYFQEENTKVTCFNCQGKGHMSFQCIEEKKEKPCYLCGEMGHDRKFCPRDLCYRCNTPGHVSRDCTQNFQNVSVESKQICWRCGTTGHLKESCNANLKEKERAPKHELYCYNCGERGHRGENCCEQKISDPIYRRFNEFNTSSRPSFSNKRDNYRPKHESFKSSKHKNNSREDTYKRKFYDSPFYDSSSEDDNFYYKKDRKNSREKRRKST